MNENELSAVEVSIETAKASVAYMDSVDALSKEKHFNKVVGEGYFKEEAARIAGMLADPTMQGEVDQRELFSQIKAIGHFRQYLIQIKRNGMIMKEGLDENEELANELRGEA